MWYAHIPHVKSVISREYEEGVRSLSFQPKQKFRTVVRLVPTDNDTNPFHPFSFLL